MHIGSSALRPAIRPLMGWSALGLFLFWMSAALALLYLTWLGYELRYVAPAKFVRATALRGD
jgi:hypothetical protein